MCTLRLFIFLFIFPLFLSAQNSVVFRIDSLPPNGIILKSGWKFKVGDNPEYASPNYMDTAWQSIIPYTDISYLPQLPKNGDIFWLRLPVFLDSTIREPLFMMIDQVGASEIYLDGQLMYQLGTLSQNPHNIKGFSPHLKPYILPLKPDKIQVLAIRYAIPPQVRYSFFMGFANRLCKIVVANIDKTMTAYRTKYVYSDDGANLRTGIFCTLALLFLVFYLFYPTQKNNFYFFVYACLYALFVKIFTFRSHTEAPELWIWCYWAILIVNYIASMCLLTGIYHLFNQKFKRLFWGILITGLIAIPCGIYISWGWVFPMMLFLFLLYGVIINISLKAAKKKQKGAMIIVVGSTIVFAAWFLCLLGLFIYPIFLFYDVLQSISIIALPIAIAIYVGYDSAMTNHSLQEKLKEIETFSQEKQRMLITQKEMLEKQVNERTFELNQSLKDLKAAQAQLIQVETLQNLEFERTRIARDIHDDISSGLSAINLLANYIKTTPLSIEAKTEIKHIAESSTVLNQRIREIIWAINSDSDNVASLAHFIRRHVSDFGEMHHIDVRFDTPENVRHLKLSNEEKRNLFLCVKETLNNTAKYAQATLVEVFMNLTDSQMTLTIKDNGIGFDFEKALKNGGNGLKNIQERMKQIGGEAIFLNNKGSEMALKLNIG